MHNWLYNDERMNLRADSLSQLLQLFGWQLNDNGEPVQSTQSMYECAHDWVSQGNPMAEGILEYYKNYYRVKL